MQTFSKTQLTHLANSLKSFLLSTHNLQSKQIIYFVGITGSGKSLVINHMLGHPLQQTKIHGVKQITLIDPSPDPTDPQPKPQIGTDLATSCTMAPSLYNLKQYENLMLCDTSGFNDQGPSWKTCELLNEFYLTKAESIAAIIFVVNMNDLRSQRGGGFAAVFQELDRISNFQEIKKRIQFIINYKNIYEDEVEELFEQLVTHEKQIFEAGQSESLRRLEYKSKFFEAIFDKQTYTDQPDLEKFRHKIMIATKQQLLKVNSTLRKTFFQRVNQLRNKQQKLHLNPSKSRMLLTKHLVRSILSRQSQFEKCFTRYSMYSKSKIIEINFWNKFQYAREESTNMKAIRLSDILLSTDVDVEQTKRIIYEINAQIAEFEHLKQQLFVAYSLEQDEKILHKINEFPIVINLHFQIKNIIKQIQGFQIVKQSLDLKKGRYDLRLKTIQSQPSKTVKILAIASYQDRDKDMIQHLCKERNKFTEKLESKDKLKVLPFKQQLGLVLDLVKQTKDQSYFVKFVEDYSVSNQQMYRCLPTRDDIRQYYNELTIYQAIISNVKIKKECINLTFVERLKEILFLRISEDESVQRNRGYCGLNYHKIQKLVKLQCGHEYEKYCFERWYIGEVKEKEKQQKQQKYKCIICGKMERVMEIGKGEKDECRKEFEEFWMVKELKDNKEETRGSGVFGKQ